MTGVVAGTGTGGGAHEKGGQTGAVGGAGGVARTGGAGQKIFGAPYAGAGISASTLKVAIAGAAKAAPARSFFKKSRVGILMTIL